MQCADIIPTYRKQNVLAGVQKWKIDCRVLLFAQLLQAILCRKLKA